MSDKKRKYTKTSPTWEKRKKQAEANKIAKAQKVVDSNSSNSVKDIKIEGDSFEPAMCGEPFVNHAIGSAGYGGRDSSGSTGYRKNRAAVANDPRRFQALKNTGSPYLESEDSYAIKEAIELCKKAYYNVATFANAIDILSEFSNTHHYLEGGTAQSRKFFESWLKFVDVEPLKQQYFREFFRSGNVFYHKVEGKLDLKGIKVMASMTEGEGSAPTKLPLKYILLNPADIIAHKGVAFDPSSYSQILSHFQLQKLRAKSTEKEKIIFNALPAEMRSKINNGEFSKDGMAVTFDPSKTLMSFYKKQDYEPFAVPFGYRVLDDINAKLELKRIDASIARTVENVILLITMGESAKDGGSGVNVQNIKAMQGLFQNETTGRALVSDYTTKAEFIIPDLKKVMGKEKYEILNQDIKEGLQNIIVGNENYSSTQVKAEMFLERLREARNSFINDIIQPEMDNISKLMGFKKPVEFKFKDFDLQDENTMLRVVTRLIELSVLTPEQGMAVIHTGEFPSSENLKKGHKQFVEDKKEGLYNPIVGGVPQVAGPEGTADANPMQQKGNQGNPNDQSQQNKTNKGAGRPTGKASVEDYSSIHKSILELSRLIVDKTKAKYEMSDLNQGQLDMCKSLCSSIVMACDMKDWNSKAKASVESPSTMLELFPMQEVADIASDTGLDDYASAIFYHASK